MRWLGLVGLVCVGSCSGKGDDDGESSLPEVPAHDRDVAGAMHALGFETPFLCLARDGTAMELCPDERPANAQLSCDASGCHGDFDYAPGTDPATRHLLGSDGPSCFACHGEVWSDWKGGTDGTTGLPDVPAHDRAVDGVLHALGMETPFLCASPDGTKVVTCPDTRPPDARLSCDASGCHGDFDYTPGTNPETRSLLGSDGPSCFACHGEVWSDRATGDGGVGGIPAAPAHNESEDGVRHARGLETPFLCLAPNGAAMVGCPDVRPPDAQLSCDASGCHGDFDYAPGTDPATRHVLGSDGPSCFGCHGQEWSNQKGGRVPFDDDDDDEDDDD